MPWVDVCVTASVSGSACATATHLQPAAPCGCSLQPPTVAGQLRLVDYGSAAIFDPEVGAAGAWVDDNGGTEAYQV